MKKIFILKPTVNYTTFDDLIRKHYTFSDFISHTGVYVGDSECNGDELDDVLGTKISALCKSAIRHIALLISLFNFLLFTSERRLCSSNATHSPKRSSSFRVLGETPGRFDSSSSSTSNDLKGRFFPFFSSCFLLDVSWFSTSSDLAFPSLHSFFSKIP